MKTKLSLPHRDRKKFKYKENINAKNNLILDMYIFINKIFYSMISIVSAYYVFI